MHVTYPLHGSDAFNKPLPENSKEAPVYCDHATAHDTVEVAFKYTQCWLSFLPQHPAAAQSVPLVGVSSPAQNFLCAFKAAA